MKSAMVTRVTAPTTATRSILLAGAAYFATVFAVGFALGTVRTLLVQDAPGAARMIGVLIELPVMLWASWLLCGVVVRRFAVPRSVVARAATGAIAFALLLLAEMTVGALLFHRTVVEHFSLYADASYALGLAAQVAFAVMPLLHLQRSESSPA